MASRGTRAAQAYTEMHVDGSDMNKEIVDSVEDAQPGVEKAGRKQGEQFGDAFGKSFGDRIAKKIGKQLDKSLTRSFDRAGKNVGKSLGKAIEKNVGDALENVGRMMDDLKNDLATVSGNAGGGRGGGGGNKPLATGGRDDGSRKVFKIDDNFSVADQFEKARIALHKAANDAIEADDIRLVKAQERIRKQAETAFEREQAAYSKMWNAAHAEDIKRTQKTAATFEKIWEAAHAEDVKRTRKTADEFDKTWNAAHAENVKRTRKSADAFTKIWAAAHAEDIKRTKASEALAEKSLRARGSMGDRVGRMFGAGSRSNTLNILGKSMGGLINLSSRLGRAASSMTSTFTTGFKAAAEAGGTLRGIMGGISALGTNAATGVSKMFTGLIASGPAAVGAIVVIVAALSVLISVIGALIGIMTALIATVAAGLTAALAVLGGAMFAVIAAGGLLTAAFMSMDDAQKSLLKNSFIPLRNEMAGIGQLMINEMVPAFATWSTNLQNALALVIPLATVMGRAFAQAGNNLTASFSGPGFQAMATALGTYLPSIVNRLSMALGSFLNGAMGLFAALMPYVDRFSGYLARLTERFSNWANSVGGQNAIADFMDRALVSLQSLWDAVREFSGFIAAVLFSPDAMNAGNTMFDSIAATFEKFRSAVAEAAANGDLKRWFDDAIQFGGDLWTVMESLYEIFIALYNSGTLEAFGGALVFAAGAVSGLTGPLTGLADTLGFVLSPIDNIVGALTNLGNTANWAMDMINRVAGTTFGTPTLGQTVNNMLGSVGGSLGVGGAGAGGAGGSAYRAPMPSLGETINRGAAARSRTSEGAGGTKAEAKYVNPYVSWAEKLVKDGPSTSRQLKTAIKQSSKTAQRAVQSAARSDSLVEARAVLTGEYKDLKAKGKSGVDSAQSNLNSAARRLASASSPAEAKKALKEVTKAQKDLKKAQEAQRKLNDAANIIAGQKIVRSSAVDFLVAGGKTQNATLAEYAAARERVAGMLEIANEKLVEAIALRDDYFKQVADSTRAFGALTTATAQSLNGVEQALTANDITQNLRDRLAQIKKFQENMRLLLAQGLSQEAYKQIMDQGVEGGSAYADALVQGGASAVNQTNSLVSQIGAASDALGAAASSRLYQAGVDAAQGLVDGLTSLSAQLDSAAAKLGDSIAKALKKALGIKSPSRVMIAAMGDVGDGIEKGLDDQSSKVGVASARLSKAIQVSPEVAAHAATQGQSPYVSGNGAGDQRPIDLTIITPTEDPHAVATEVINEVVGRL